MPVRLKPNFIVKSISDYEYEVLRYNDFGGVALLKGSEPIAPYALVRELRPVNGGKHVWIHVNAFSDRYKAVKEFETECWLARRAEANEE